MTEKGMTEKGIDTDAIKYQGLQDPTVPLYKPEPPPTLEVLVGICQRASGKGGKEK
jgi:hypothetical protein